MDHIGTESQFTADVPFGVRMPWEHYWEQNALRDHAETVIRMLSKPILPDIGLLEADHAAAVQSEQQRAWDAFRRSYPEVPLQALWDEICQNKAEIPAIADLPEECLADFINVTAWCYAKEGTGVSGRFSVNRLWRTARRDAASIRNWIRPLLFETKCGVCGETARASSGSASIASCTRPTRIECIHCGHVDQVGRPAQSLLPRELPGIQPRLSCQCTRCQEVRLQACSTAANDIGDAIDAHARWLADYVRSGSVEFFDRDVYTSSLELMTRCEEALRSSPSLLSALRETASGARHLHSVGLAHVIEDGVARGWLEPTSITPLEKGPDLEVAVVRGIDLAGDEGGRSVVNTIREDMTSFDVNRVVKGCIEILSLSTPLAPVLVRVRWLGESGVLSKAERSGDAVTRFIVAAKSAADFRGHEHQPADADSDALYDDLDPSLAHGAEMLRRAVRVVDQELGAGVSRRCPELVREVMRAALDAEAASGASRRPGSG